MKLLEALKAYRERVKEAKIYWKKVDTLFENIRQYAKAREEYQQFKEKAQDLYGDVHAGEIQHLATQRFHQALEDLRELNEYYEANDLKIVEDKRALINFLAFDRRHLGFFEYEMKEPKKVHEILGLAEVIKRYKKFYPDAPIR